MKITSVRINKCLVGKILAYVSVTFDEQMVVHGMKIVQKPDGTRFLAMPTLKRNDNSFKDIAHPIDRGFRQYMTELIFKEFQQQELASVKAN